MVLHQLKKLLIKKKLGIAVLMGGPSSEHDVSLASGKMVVKHLDKKKYEVLPIIISKSGEWPMKLIHLAKKCDLAFIAMHGEYGEDGKLQALLEKYKVPYTGSNSKSSKLAMDKEKSASLFKKNKITSPPFIVIKRNALKADWKKAASFGFPLVVKPADRGSSVGVTIVKKISELAPALNLAFASSNKALIQKFINGRELTCGVIEQKSKLTPLPVTEIIPKTKFFDYKAKYTPGGAKEITPAKIPEKTAKKIQLTAVSLHRAVRAKGYSRSDFILDKTGGLFALEINTLPGLTKNSLLPQAAKKAGFSFGALLDMIIDNGRGKR